MLQHSPLRPLTRAAAMWHTSPRLQTTAASEARPIEMLTPSTLKVA
jgi:hypothetical protein